MRSVVRGLEDLSLYHHSEDALAPAVGPVLAAGKLYEANSDAIHQAAKALAGLGGAASRIDDWVAIVDKVVDGLDELSKSTAFPFVGGKPDMIYLDHHANIITSQLLSSFSKELSSLKHNGDKTRGAPELSSSRWQI